MMVPRLVVAEGDTELAEFIHRIAGKNGWNVTLCRDGAELLLVLAGTSEPVLAIVGMEIDTLDGAEVVRHLYDDRQQAGDGLWLCLLGENSDARMLAARMIADAGDIEVAGMLFKPFDQDELQRILAGVHDAMSGLPENQTDVRPGLWKFLSRRNPLKGLVDDQKEVREKAAAPRRVLWERIG